MTGKNTTTILYILLAVILTLQVKSCFFDKEHKPEQMIRNEEKLKYLEEKRLSDSASHVIELAARDSIIVGISRQFTATTPILQQSKKDYEKIRPVINSLNDNELLQRANGFRPE